MEVDMSTAYYVYAEIKIGNEWKNLNPIIRDADGDYRLIPIYTGNSSFYDVFLDLESNLLSRGLPEDLSLEVRSQFHTDLDEKTDFWMRDCTWREYYSQCVFSVSYRPYITDKIIRNRQFKFEGYVTKRTIAAFEAHDIECIPEWLSDAEYKALSEKSRRQYSFYQWNEYGDDYEIYSTIVRRVETLLYAYDYGYDRSFKYDEFFYDPKIRLIVEQSG
jgi:hypothetical protein